MSGPHVPEADQQVPAEHGAHRLFLTQLLRCPARRHRWCWIGGCKYECTLWRGPRAVPTPRADGTAHQLPRERTDAAVARAAQAVQRVPIACHLHGIPSLPGERIPHRTEHHRGLIVPAAGTSRHWQDPHHPGHRECLPRWGAEPHRAGHHSHRCRGVALRRDRRGGFNEVE